jgi:hypothetical protein
VRDRCETETGLGGIVQMRAHVSEIDERHVEVVKLREMAQQGPCVSSQRAQSTSNWTTLLPVMTVNTCVVLGNLGNENLPESASSSLSIKQNVVRSMTMSLND